MNLLTIKSLGAKLAPNILQEEKKMKWTHAVITFFFALCLLIGFAFFATAGLPEVQALAAPAQPVLMNASSAGYRFSELMPVFGLLFLVGAIALAIVGRRL